MEFKEYFGQIKSKLADATEYTFRTELETLLKFINQDKRIKIIQETKKSLLGRPDFTIKKGEAVLGYIETKPITEDLESVIQSEQIKRYLAASENFVLTNYKEFILFKGGKNILRAKLFETSDKNLDEDKIKSVIGLLNIFFASPVTRIAKTENLSEALAYKTLVLKELIKEHLNSPAETTFKKRLLYLYEEVFRKTLVEDLEKEEFIDAYSQTVAYGLFLAKLNNPQSLNMRSAFLSIPKSLGSVQEIFKIIEPSELPDSILWIVDEIIETLNQTDMGSLRKELSFGSDAQHEDPYVYFYENFLRRYDKNKSKSMGVYYTPIPAVRFIVQSIDKILKDNFNKSGFGDKGVTVLDFATGTGTFLFETFKTALEGIDKDLRPRYIRERLLKNFLGFEYLIAPYTIAHLKLTQYLEEMGYKFNPDNSEDRVGVYLTDTLGDSKSADMPLYPSISGEGRLAYDIKANNPILVVMGNPPYYSKSRNNQPFIMSLIEEYKATLEDEGNIQPINDDYIKFIRFAQCKIEGKKYEYKNREGTKVSGKIIGSQSGIVGIITNNSYLDGIIHRQMRKSLLETFDRIYILNLHGNSSRGEKDKNIFDIRVGVSIALFVRTGENLPISKRKIFYRSILDEDANSREEKFKFLLESDVSSVKWNKIPVSQPYYWFVKKPKLKQEKRYKSFMGLNKIFENYNSGIEFGRDELFIDFDKDILKKRIVNLFKGNCDKSFVKDYKIETAGFNLLERIEKHSYDEKYIREICYRPFDFRWAYYHPGVTRRPSLIMRYINKNSPALIFVRQVAEDSGFNHAFITDMILDRRLTISNRGACFAAPLYIGFVQAKEDKNGHIFKAEENLSIKPNFTEEFHKFTESIKFLKTKPERILSFIYAVLCSPLYREKYGELLKTDFPRIPFDVSPKTFEVLSNIGDELTKNTLLTINHPASSFPKFKGKGNIRVDAPCYDSASERLYINKGQYLDKVREEVYNFTIGGYQALDKYLKAREGRELSLEEIEHLKKTVCSIENILALMNELNNYDL